MKAFANTRINGQAMVLTTSFKQPLGGVAEIKAKVEEINGFRIINLWNHEPTMTAAQLHQYLQLFDATVKGRRNLRRNEAHLRLAFDGGVVRRVLHRGGQVCGVTFEYN